MRRPVGAVMSTRYSNGEPGRRANKKPGTVRPMAAARRERPFAAAVAARRPPRGARPVHGHPGRRPGARLRDPRRGRASARPGWPISASPWPTGRAATSPGPPRRRDRSRCRSGALAHLLPAGIGDERGRSGRGDVRGPTGAARPGGQRPARAVRRRPPPARRHVGDAGRPARRRRSRVPRRRRCGAASTLPPGLDAAVAAGPGAPHRPRRTSTGRRRHAAAPRAAAVRSRRARSPRSGRPARATCCSCGSSCSARVDGGHLVAPARRVAAGRSARHDAAPARAGRRPPRRAWAAAAADALDILAVWEPAGLSTLEAIVGRDQLEVLDRAGLLAVRTDGRRQQVTLAHPLYGEILRARMPALTRRRLLLEHADRIDARRRAATGGRRSAWPPPASRRRARPTRACSSGRPGWPATARTSPRSSGSAGPRSSTA